ncbi:hypothetical protein BN2497_10481 [Janthinobacterium sp. CG23_2]|nr:hypothetical protein BN2497_10481 [Janthinobacterium sp. CG23_2]CUU31638.1 hypothetical protein BN3177_10481 [Janthinobacterium sp. CG23_2]
MPLTQQEQHHLEKVASKSCDWLGTRQELTAARAKHIASERELAEAVEKYMKQQAAKKTGGES